MGCDDQERDLIGAGVRFGLYFQSLGIVFLLMKVHASGISSAVDRSLWTFLALLLTLLVQTIKRWFEGGSNYFSDKEVVVLLPMIGMYSTLFLAALRVKCNRSSRAQIMAVGEKLRFARSQSEHENCETTKEKMNRVAKWEAQGEMGKQHLSKFFVTAYVPLGILDTALILFWAYFHRFLQCGEESTFVFMFIKVHAYGWYRWFALAFTVLNVSGTAYRAFYYLRHYSSILDAGLEMASIFEEKVQAQRAVQRVEARPSAVAERAAIENVELIDKVHVSMDDKVDKRFEILINERGLPITKHMKGWLRQEKKDLQEHLFFTSMFLIVSAIAVELILYWNSISVSLGSPGNLKDLGNFSQLLPLIIGVIDFSQACLPLDPDVSDEDTSIVVQQQCYGEVGKTDCLDRWTETALRPDYQDVLLSEFEM